MKKVDFFLQILTPIMMIISAIWFAANLDKQIALSHQSIASMNEEIGNFEQRQRMLNDRQDRTIDSYKSYLDNKIDLILNSMLELKNGTVDCKRS